MRSLPLLCVAALLLAPTVSMAAPVTYGFTGGSVTLTVSHSGGISAPVTVDLNGVQVTVDTANEALISLELTAAGPIVLSLASEYNGYDTIVLDSLRLSAGLGALIPVAPGPPAEYFFVASPLLSEAVFGATGTSTPIVGQAISSSGTAGGPLFIDPVLNELTLSGITIASFGPEGDKLSIKGDFIFEGVIPEPSAALVFVIGMATFSVARQAGRASARGMHPGSSSKG